MGAFATIYKQGGIKALYQGVSATTVRAALLTCGQLASYEYVHHSLRTIAAMPQSPFAATQKLF